MKKMARSLQQQHHPFSVEKYLRKNLQTRLKKTSREKGSEEEDVDPTYSKSKPKYLPPLDVAKEASKILEEVHEVLQSISRPVSARLPKISLRGLPEYSPESTQYVGLLQSMGSGPNVLETIPSRASTPEPFTHMEWCKVFPMERENVVFTGRRAGRKKKKKVLPEGAAAGMTAQPPPGAKSPAVQFREELMRRLIPSIRDNFDARERFKHAIKIVLLLLKWISSLAEKGEEDVEKDRRTFTDLATDAFTSDEMKNCGLSFDLSHYKAKKEINISNEAKHILCLPSNQRTAEQLQTALFNLQHIQSFAEYPLHMQEKLCKVAWFQKVPPKRVIIRQGHVAENFYFILSGQAMVRILEKNPKTGETNLRTATIMKKGTSFGELALLHHSTRTATVVSQDTVHLLAIGRDDFFDIFMSGQRPGETPEHIAFVSSLDFMKNWPTEKLLEQPECCLFHFFKRGVVILKDSNTSDWLYIVKSGSCRVMKELKGVTPRLGRTSACSQLEPGKLPHINLARAAEPKVRTGRRQYSDRYKNTQFGHNSHSEGRWEQRPYTEDGDVAEESQENKRRPHLTDGTANGGFSKGRYILFPKMRDPHFSASSRASENPKRRPGPGINGDDLVDERNLPLKGPVFVQVQMLKPRDVFGLTTIRFENDPRQSLTSVSLVSNGAECIMLSKRFFMDHANETVKKMIRHQLRHYPTEKTLQENLQIKVDWDFYKSRLMSEIVDKQKMPSLSPASL